MFETQATKSYHPAVPTAVQGRLFVYASQAQLEEPPFFAVCSWQDFDGLDWRLTMINHAGSNNFVLQGGVVPRDNTLVNITITLFHNTIPAEIITDLTWCRFIVFELI